MAHDPAGQPLRARPAWSEVDLDALAANLQELRRRAGRPVRVIGSIKANAYGHGAVAVARRLEQEGVEMLATGSLEEALAVRRGGVALPILLFAGALPDAAGALLADGLIPTVHDPASLEAVAAAAQRRHDRPARVWLKVDAGLGRLGFPLAYAAAATQRLVSAPGVALDGVYTHLPFADEPGRAWAEERLSGFQALLEELAALGLRIPWTQALSSAGVLAGLADPTSAVCPGHALYGIAPASAAAADSSGLVPVLRAVKTRLVHVSEPAPAAGRAGVGGARSVAAAATTGVVPFGQTDGYRAAGSGGRAAMLVAGRRVPVLGVSLEHTTLDLTGIDARVGDEVVVLGRQGDETLGAVELAAWQGATASEIVLSFDRRLRRVYVETRL